MNSVANGVLVRHRSAVLLLAAALPLVACACLAPLRDQVQNTNAALVLVLIVVAAASTGLRLAGVLAAVSSAVWFDFFLTAPYHTLDINDYSNIETAVLLVLVGVAVTEVALWGRRQQARASRQQGYLAGVLHTVDSVAADGPNSTELSQIVEGRLTEVLQIDDSHFSRQPAPRVLARLERDGQVTRDGRDVDVVRAGLPTDTEIELPVQYRGVVYGRYLLTASTRIYRPGLEQRQVAIALADQVGAALALDTQAGPVRG